MRRATNLSLGTWRNLLSSERVFHPSPKVGGPGRLNGKGSHNHPPHTHPIFALQNAELNNHGTPNFGIPSPTTDDLLKTHFFYWRRPQGARVIQRHPPHLSLNPLFVPRAVGEKRVGSPRLGGCDVTLFWLWRNNQILKEGKKRMINTGNKTGYSRNIGKKEGEIRFVSVFEITILQKPHHKLPHNYHTTPPHHRIKTVFL